MASFWCNCISLELTIVCNFRIGGINDISRIKNSEIIIGTGSENIWMDFFQLMQQHLPVQPFPKAQWRSISFMRLTPYETGSSQTKEFCPLLSDHKRQNTEYRIQNTESLLSSLIIQFWSSGLQTNKVTTQLHGTVQLEHECYYGVTSISVPSLYIQWTEKPYL